jgi:hypothetical protein
LRSKRSATHSPPIDSIGVGPKLFRYRRSRSVGAATSGGDGNRDTVRTVWYVRGVMGDVGGDVVCVGSGMGGDGEPVFAIEE